MRTNSKLSYYFKNEQIMVGMVDMAVTADSDGEKDRNPAMLPPLQPSILQSLPWPLQLLPQTPEQ
jgi:hypothetical protein